MSGNRRFPRAKWVLPDVIDPPERICFQIQVPKNRFHLAAFRGALLNLASAVNWQDDPDHTAKEVAKVWDKIYTQVTACVECDTNTGISLEDFMSQQIRISPDDSCIIQMWCIDHWEDWYDPRACIPGSIEQPTNGEALEPGECREWDVSLRGSEKWLIPVGLSAGDVIETTGATGAWNDGTLGWNCVTGQVFFAGTCGISEAAEAGDPMQTVNHMRLIINIDGAWYDGVANTIAVPFGAADVMGYFQANDDSLEDNSGTVSFHVKVCRQQPPTDVIGITYEFGLGIGPSECNPGDIIAITATENGATNWYVQPIFSREVKLTVVDQGDFVQVSAPGTIYSEEYDATNTRVQYLTKGTEDNLTDMAVRSDVKKYNGGTGTPGSVFTVTLKIENP